MKSFILFSILLLTQFATAQEIIEPCKFGQPLIDALQSSYTPSNPLGYGPARDILYSSIDSEDNELSGIYTNFTITLDPSQDPSQDAFSKGINAEHVYPQSLGAGEEPMRGDLHNIFPSKENVNASRGNCPYSDIEDSDTDSWFFLDMQSSSVPIVEIEKYSEKDEEDCFFEPRESVKGDIARAMFYFYSIYQTVADNEDSNYLSSQKDILYQWHQNDPADEAEKTRSSLISLEQGNQNPFVVDSSLVRRAFFEADASYMEGDINCYSIFIPTTEINKANWVNISTNVVADELIIYSTKQNGIISISDIQGRFIKQYHLENETTIQLNDLNQGIYILSVRSEGLQSVFRFFKT